MVKKATPAKELTLARIVELTDRELWRLRSDIEKNYNIDLLAELDGYDPLAKYEKDSIYDATENENIGLSYQKPPTEDDYTETGLLKSDFQWKSIPWLPHYRRKPPIGYKQREDDPNILDPIPFELEVLELAKRHVKKYSYATVAKWMSEIIGKKINHDTLWRRIQLDKQKDKRARSFRKWAARYKKALLAAEKIEREEVGAGRPRPYDEEGNPRNSARPLARPSLGAGAFRSPDDFDDGTPSEHGYDEAVKGKRRTRPRCPRSTHPRNRPGNRDRIPTESGTTD